jgi:hypothetical protein
MVEFPQSGSRKSSLRSGGKTPSPDAHHVRFAGAGLADSSSQSPRTPVYARVRPPTPGAPKKPTKPRVTKRTSPTLQFSPKTARKAREAARFTKTIDEQEAFLDREINSPPPVSSKNFTGKGIRVRTGLPPSPEKLEHLRNEANSRVRPTRDTHLPTPPPTPRVSRGRGHSPPHMGDTNTDGATSSQRTITITEIDDAHCEIYIDGVSDWLAFPTKPKTKIHADKPPIEIPTKALLEHMNHLKQNLRPLGLEELHIQFYLLQKMLRQFTKRHFVTPWSPSRLAAFSLADLATDHAPFYRIAGYLADGSTFQEGWSSFLTSEHTRPHLVYAILSEWLKYNVFGHSCFGLSEEEDAAMTAIDIRYLHYDGFVRTKERAKLLARILANKPAWEQEMDVGAAVEKVVSELMIVLAPLLPQSNGQLSILRSQLTSIVDIAANLHQCIRLTGMDGTIIRFHTHTKGDPFAYTARQNCINKSTVKKTIDDMMALRNAEKSAADAAAAAAAARRFGAAGDRKASEERQTRAASKLVRGKDKLLIKMPCFPLILAVVPFGPTLRDFAVEQDMYNSVIRSVDLPAVSKDDGSGPMYIEDIPAEIVRAACFEAMPESCHKDYGMVEDGEPMTQAYGSYVKQYILNECDVYCEWEFDGDDEDAAGKAVTLRQAVEQAQREKYGYVVAERRDRRNKIARNVKLGLGIAGGVAAVAVGVGIVKPALAYAAVRVANSLKLPSRISVEDVKGAVQSAMEAADAKTKPFQKAVRWPFKISKGYAKNWSYGNTGSRLASGRSRARS